MSARSSSDDILSSAKFTVAGKTRTIGGEDRTVPLCDYDQLASNPAMKPNNFYNIINI
jgi:hypothetical protein